MEVALNIEPALTKRVSEVFPEALAILRSPPKYKTYTNPTR